MHLCSAGAVHLVLEGSAHDTFNDIVQLVALRYTRVMHYLRMFKPVSPSRPGAVPGNLCQILSYALLGGSGNIKGMPRHPEKLMPAFTSVSVSAM